MLEGYGIHKLIWDAADDRLGDWLVASPADAEGRGLKLHVRQSGHAADLTGASVYLIWRHRRTGTRGCEPMEEVNATLGVFSVYYPAAMCEAEGMVDAQCMVSWGDRSISTRAFVIQVQKAAVKLRNDAAAIEKWAPALLLMELDKVLWRKERHIQIRQLWEYLCTYCYLPRLAGYAVLEDAIVEGTGSEEFFGIAAGVGDGRYLDPSLGVKKPFVNQSDYLVKVSVMKDELERRAEEKAAEEHRRRERELELEALRGGSTSGDGGRSGAEVIDGSGETDDVSAGMGGGEQQSFSLPSSFFMSADLDTTRVNRDVQRIVSEIVSQLQQVEGVKLKLTFEVEATAEDGFPVPTKRAVSENCGALHIEKWRFDE